MKLFYAPGACSIGIHVLLEELGNPYETQALDLRAGEHHNAAYKAQNPKAKVPALLLDNGATLTEYGAITHYLTAGTTLAASGREPEARAIEALEYIVATIHMQGYQRLLRPANFTPNAADEAWVKARGRDIAVEGYRLMAEQLGTQDYLFGSFGAVDAALFYVEFWSTRANVPLPPACAAHLARMLARPAVARVMQAEGLTEGLA